MPDASPASVIIGIVSSLVLLIGYILTQRGKKGDQAQEAIKSQFDRMLTENRYLAEQLAATRKEWEARWDRQMVRCRKITDTAANTISDLLRFVPPDKQSKANRTINEIATHVDGDHSDSIGGNDAARQ